MPEGVGGENLASAYVTILPDMSKFVEELASKLQAAVDSQHPTVKVKAELDTSGLAGEVASAEATAQAEADAHPVEVPVKTSLSGALLSDAETASLTSQWAKIAEAAIPKKTVQTMAQALAEQGITPDMAKDTALKYFFKVPMTVDDSTVMPTVAKDVAKIDAMHANIHVGADTADLTKDTLAGWLNAYSVAKSTAAANILRGAQDLGMPITDAQKMQIAMTPSTAGAQGIDQSLGISAAILAAAGGGGGGGGGGGFLGMLSGFFGGGNGDKSGAGFGKSTGGKLLWGGGSNIPFLGALAGMGSIASLMGFGPEHAITTAIGLGGSAVGAGIGGGLLGAGMLATTGVGFATDLAGTGQAAGDAKKVYTAQQALGTAQAQFGSSSGQALTAQLALNTALQGFSPIARGAVTAVATMANTLHGEFNLVTGQAEKMGAQILLSFENVAAQYIPTIGKFATINTGIIQSALKPFTAWLSGPGLGIFTNIEQIFTNRLPVAMHAFTQGAEVAIRAIGYFAQYGGGLMEKIDKFLTGLNNPVGFGKFEHFMAAMIHDFEVWKGFVEILVKDIYDLFKLDAGLGTGIITTLTTMLDKLHVYLTSSTGKAAISSLFAVHKQQIIDLLGLIPPLVKAFEPILRVMPTMTALTLPFISALVQLLNLLERIPFGVGPAIAGLLGFSLLLGHLIGYGKALDFLKATLFTIIPAAGGVVRSLIPLAAGFGSTSIMAKGLNIALGIGLVGALIAVGFGLDFVFSHFGTLQGVLATTAVAVTAFWAVWNLPALSTIKTAILGLVTQIRGISLASIASAATQEAASTASTSAVVEGDLAKIGSLEELQMVYAATGDAAVASAIVQREAALAGAGAAGAAGAAGGEVGAAGAAAAGTAGLGEAASAAALPVAALAVYLGIFMAVTHGAASGVQILEGNLKSLPTNTLPQVNSAIDATKAKIASLKDQLAAGPKGPVQIYGGRGTTAPLNAGTIQTQAISDLNTQLGALQTKAKIAGDNAQWLADHFHITTQQATQLAESLGNGLTNKLNTSGPFIYKFGAALQQMGVKSSGATQALSTLAQQSGQTMAQVAQQTSQAAAAMQTTMASFGNVVTNLSTAITAPLPVSSAQITQFYNTQTTNAAGFANGIQSASTLGFSPTIISQILTQGPQAGLTTLKGILQGATGASGAAFVTMTNQSQTALGLQSAQMIEMATLMAALQTHSATVQKQIQGNLGSAMSIWQNNMSNSLKGVSASFVNSFAGGVPGLVKVANEFGLTVPNVIMANGKSMSLAAYYQLQQYFQALRAHQKEVDAAAGKPASSLPNAISGETLATKTAVNKLIKTAVDQLTGGKGSVDGATAPISGSLPSALASSNGAVSAAALTNVHGLANTLISGKTLLVTPATGAAAVLPNAIKGTVSQTTGAGQGHLAALVSVFTGGKSLLGTTGMTAGKNVSDGVKNHDAKPAGVALVNGIIAGIQSRQGAMNTATLAVIKNAIDSARPLVGGQSLGVALDQGIQQGIQNGGAGINAAAQKIITDAKGAAAAAAGNPKSPAPVFVPLGKSIAEGIAFGITSNAHLVSTAASSAVKGALVAAQTAGANGGHDQLGPTGPMSPASWSSLVAAGALGGTNYLKALYAQTHLSSSGANGPAPSDGQLAGTALGTSTNSGTVVHYNPQYTISGGADPTTVATFKTMLDQHDNQLIAKIYARGG